MQIPRGDVSAMMAMVVAAKRCAGDTFVQYRRMRGRMLVFDQDGKMVKLGKDPETGEREKPGPGDRVVFSVPRADICHVCGYCYEDEKGVPKAKECPMCAATFSERPAGWSGRAMVRGRESAVEVVGKKYLDQARDLVMVWPLRLAQWRNQEGLEVIARMCEAVDANGGEYPGIEAVKVSRDAKRAYNGLPVRPKKTANMTTVDMDAFAHEIGIIFSRQKKADIWSIMGYN